MSSARPDIEVHLTIVGALHTAFGVLALLGLLAAAFVGIGLGVAMAEAGHGMLGSLLLGFLVSLAAVLSLPGLIGGIGLLMRKRWSRIVVLVVSCVHLLNVPFGTAMGAYSLWVLLQDDARRALGGERW